MHRRSTASFVFSSIPLLVLPSCQSGSSEKAPSYADVRVSELQVAETRELCEDIEDYAAVAIDLERFACTLVAQFAVAASGTADSELCEETFRECMEDQTDLEEETPPSKDICITEEQRGACDVTGDELVLCANDLSDEVGDWVDDFDCADLEVQTTEDPWPPSCEAIEERCPSFLENAGN